MKGHTGGVNTLCIVINKQILYSGSVDLSILLWDLATYQLIKTLSMFTSEIKSIIANSNGSHLYVGSVDQTIRVFEPETDKIKII